MGGKNNQMSLHSLLRMVVRVGTGYVLPLLNLEMYTRFNLSTNTKTNEHRYYNEVTRLDMNSVRTGIL